LKVFVAVHSVSLLFFCGKEATYLEDMEFRKCLLPCTALLYFSFAEKKSNKRKPPEKKASFFPVGATMGDSATALPS